MNNKIVSDYNTTYERLSKSAARKAFDNGEQLYVMSIDRNPINSLSSAHIYHIGCKPIYSWYSGKEVIKDFNDLLEDFSEWLENDGYGHMPQKYDAQHYRFSYWKKII